MPREDITQYELTDADLARLATEALAWEGKLRYPHIRVEVDGGVVFLSGTVETLLQKAEADRDVRRIAGVTDVVNDIAVHPPREIRDEEIESVVHEALREDARLPGRDFEVSANNGVVSLRGEVTDVTQKWAAFDDVRSIPGVRDIVDEVIVLPQQASSDHTIEELVTAELVRAPAIDARRIHAHVEDGIVHLEGTLEFPDQKYEAERIAGDVPGVRGATNDIDIAA